MKASPLFSVFPVVVVALLVASLDLLSSYLLPIIYLPSNLLASSFAIISKAKSSSGFTFLLFNLIIVLLVGSSRLRSCLPREHDGSVSQHYVCYEDDKGGGDVKYYDPRTEEEGFDKEDEDEEEVDDGRGWHTIDSEDPGYDEDDEYDSEEDDDDDDDEEDEEEDGELTRRSEDFIAMMNASWRVEKLRELIDAHLRLRIN